MWNSSWIKLYYVIGNIMLSQHHGSIACESSHAYRVLLASQDQVICLGKTRNIPIVWCIYRIRVKKEVLGKYIVVTCYTSI